MAERTETVSTSEGEMEVFITHPDGPGENFPVVIQLMDALGMREELREHARRVSSWGYYVLAPDFFHRFGLKGPLDFEDEQDRDKIMTAIGELSVERATGDARASLDLAEADPAARSGKIGLYGFCMGGKLTLELAQSLGDRVAAGASIHPGGLVTPDEGSPHKHLDDVSADLYFGIADQDASASPEQMAELEKALKEEGIDYQLEWHPGALHGFMMPSRSDLYDRDTAEKVWGRIEALFASNLK